MTTGTAIAVYIANKTVTRLNIGFPRGLQPFSRHSTETIITGLTFMKKRLCRFIDDFPSNSTWPVNYNQCKGKPKGMALISTGALVACSWWVFCHSSRLI